MDLEQLESELIERYSETEDEALLDQIADVQAAMMWDSRWTTVEAT